MPQDAASPLPPPLIVAIDGPAGAGKSTVAAHLARRFGLLNLETGAMYRALAWKVLAAGIAPDDAAAVTALTEHTSISLTPGQDGNRVLLDDRDVTAELRNPAVTTAASQVSVHPAVREWMVAAQRAMGMAAQPGVVMEGRDIGTVVFPEAAVKIFLDASVEARGDRRFQQQPSVGTPAQTDRDTITRDIAARDQRDRSRETSPLRPAADAVILDTTAMSLDEVLEQTATLVAKSLPPISDK